jgi:hypothetical protein
MKYSYISKYASPTSIVKLAFGNLFNLIPMDKEKLVADALISALAEEIMNLKIYATKSLTPLEKIKGEAILTKASFANTKEIKVDDVIVGFRMFFQGNILHSDMAKKLLKAVKNYGNQADLLNAIKSDLSTDTGKDGLMKELQSQIKGTDDDDDDESWDNSEDGFFEEEDIEDFIDRVFQENINLAKENIGQIPGIGVIVIDDQKLDITELEKIVMSFEVNRLNVGIEMSCQYKIKAHRYIDEEN